MNKLIIGTILGFFAVNAQASPNFSVETGIMLDKTNSELTLVGPRVGTSLNFNVTDRLIVGPALRISKLYGKYSGKSKGSDVDLTTISMGISGHVKVCSVGFVGLGVFRNENRFAYGSNSMGFNTASVELELGLNVSENVSISYRPAVEWYFTEQRNTTGAWAGSDNSDMIDNLTHSLNVKYQF